MRTINDLLQGASLGTILSGNSFIDYPHLQIHCLEEAESFINCYGYDLVEDNQEIEKLRIEALGFLENTILNKEITIPQSIIDTTDIRYLLLWASNSDCDDRGLWSCALLRIMHSFSHCSSFYNDQYHKEIREQILSKIENHINFENEQFFIGDIALANYQSRPIKSRESVVTKLLHKVENVSADIFDWIGIRIITKKRLDAVKVLSYFRENNVIMFANIKPSRSRNTLLDLEWLKTNWEKFEYEQLSQMVQKLGFPSEQGKPVANYHTTSDYHAIQFTCRQRVRIKEASGKIISFFFPFEVQIMDEESYQESRIGDASHEKYKRRQLSAVRKRVLGALYDKLKSTV